MKSFAVLFICTQALFAQGIYGQYVNSLYSSNLANAGLTPAITGYNVANSGPFINLNSPVYNNAWSSRISPCNGYGPSPILPSPTILAPPPVLSNQAFAPSYLQAPIAPATPFLTQPNLPLVQCPNVTPYLSIYGDNLLIDGVVGVTGSLPFASSVNLYGNLPAGGNALVSGACSCKNPCVV